jgi:hypothetical protein
MSVSEDLRRNAYDVRRRLRNPPNAVVDLGIDLKRRFQPPVIIAIEPEPEPEPVVEAPVELPKFIEPHPPEILLVHSIDICGDHPISVEIKEIAPPAPPPPRIVHRIRDIQRIVAREYNISTIDMDSDRRDWKFCRPRQVAMFLARHHTPHSLPRIGRDFSGRDHTTILNAEKRIGQLCRDDAEFAYTVAWLDHRLMGGANG